MNIGKYAKVNWCIFVKDISLYSLYADAKVFLKVVCKLLGQWNVDTKNMGSYVWVCFVNEL